MLSDNVQAQNKLTYVASFLWHQNTFTNMKILVTITRLRSTSPEHLPAHCIYWNVIMSVALRTHIHPCLLQYSSSFLPTKFWSIQFEVLDVLWASIKKKKILKINESLIILTSTNMLPETNNKESAVVYKSGNVWKNKSTINKPKESLRDSLNQTENTWTLISA